MAQRMEQMLRELAREPLGDRGLEILDVELKGGSLRVILDSETPLDLDRIAEASAAISRLIDDSTDFDDVGKFNLEVSSPGVERTLRTESHFRRFVGSKVSVKTKPDFAGPRRFTGVLEGVESSCIQVKLDDPPRPEYSNLEVMLDEIERARTVFEWGSQGSQKAKTGSGSRKRKNSRTAVGKLAKD